jgi:DNA-directed RNA polymerase specialized sigma24 family protein
MRDLADDSLKALLTRLAREGGSSEVAYERVRTRLIRYLRLHLPAEADDLADRTLDRMAHRLHEGTEVHNIYLYALGVARMLVHEARARFAREQVSLEEAAALSNPPLDTEAAEERAAESEAVFAALQACMQAMSSSGAALIIDYYAGGDGTARIENRRVLADRLGIGMNALRNRALRLRDALERCVQEKLGWRDEERSFDTSDGSDEASGS